jgi:hypothetical protein
MMNNPKVSLFLTGILVLLVTLQTSTHPMGKGGVADDPHNIGLLILINRLELSPAQMKQVHFVLTNVVTEVGTLKARQEARQQEFAGELIRFIGTRDELETIISSSSRWSEQGSM